MDEPAVTPDYGPAIAIRAIASTTCEPHIGAALSEVVPVRETRRARIASGEPPEDADPWIVSAEEGGSFCAVATRAAREEDEVRLSKDACRRLVTRSGDEVALTPLPVSRRGGKAHG